MDPIAKPQFTIDDKPPAEQIASSSGELRTIAGSAAVLIAIVLAILASGVWHASNEAIASGQLVNAIDSSQVVASTEQKAVSTVDVMPPPQPPIQAPTPQPDSVIEPDVQAVQLAAVVLPQTTPDKTTIADTTLSGAVLLQIGSFDSMEAASTGWITFRERYHPAEALLPDIQSVDLGAKGTWYRLRVGPFADRVAATDACTKLQAEGASCFIAGG